MDWKHIPQFTRPANYAVDVPWNYIQSWIDRNKEDMPVELDPDFQREHVWTLKQQRRYIEFCLRGGKSAKDIYWNCAVVGVFAIQGVFGPVYLVDGKQRLNAILKFMNNEFKVFGCKFSEFTGNFPWSDLTLTFHVNDLKTKEEVIQWYLDLNFGDTPHTNDERKRVEKMLKGLKKA